MTKLTMALTGHRPQKLAGYDLQQPYYERMENQLIKLIKTALRRCDKLELHSGMALGADTVWARVIIKMRDQYPDRITFVADIPDWNQASLWPLESQSRWQYLMTQTDDVKTYSQGCDDKSYAYILNQRNIGMIDACDILIAIYDGTPGGTRNAVQYATKTKKLIHRIKPSAFN